jgi:hypothetical protein
MDGYFGCSIQLYKITNSIYKLVPKKVPNDPRLPRAEDKIIWGLGHDIDGRQAVLTLPSWGIFVGFPHGPKAKLGFLAS